MSATQMTFLSLFPTSQEGLLVVAGGCYPCSLQSARESSTRLRRPFKGSKFQLTIIDDSTIRKGLERLRYGAARGMYQTQRRVQNEALNNYIMKAGSHKTPFLRAQFLESFLSIPSTCFQHYEPTHNKSERFTSSHPQFVSSDHPPGANKEQHPCIYRFSLEISARGKWRRQTGRNCHREPSTSSCRRLPAALGRSKYSLFTPVHACSHEALSFSPRQSRIVISQTLSFCGANHVQSQHEARSLLSTRCRQSSPTLVDLHCCCCSIAGCVLVLGQIPFESQCVVSAVFPTKPASLRKSLLVFQLSRLGSAHPPRALASRKTTASCITPRCFELRQDA